jgi:hypothetical protein
MDTAGIVLSIDVRDTNTAALALVAARLLDCNDRAASSAEASGRLSLGALAPGSYRLELELAARPAISFGVELRATKAGPRLSLSAPAPRCCELTRTNNQPTLRVTLGPRHEEIVFVAGWDYSGGANTNLWAHAWRDDLYAGQTWITGAAKPLTKLIHDHTIVTHFDFSTGVRTRRVKGKRGWHVIDERLQGTAATHTGDYHDPVNDDLRQKADSISIVHVYDHITALGRLSPGCVAGFHIFSHAWAGGPILVNTSEGSRYRHSGKRDPSDKDGRSKDFDPVNMPELEHFCAAFCPSAIAKVWGCFATTAYRRLVRAAAKASDKQCKLTIAWEDDTTVERTGAEIEAEFRQSILADSYMAKLGRVTGIPVYGAPPGMGASYKRIHKHQYMFIRERVYELEYQWFATALALAPDISGHIPYSTPTQADSSTPRR